MANEIQPGYEIDEFVCAGSKQYGLRLKKLGLNADQDEKELQFEYILKLRGFSLDYQSSLILNYESFKQQVIEYAQGNRGKPIGVTNPNFIRPDIRTGSVTSSRMTKYYKPVLSKGILGSDFQVRCFGDKQT